MDNKKLLNWVVLQLNEFQSDMKSAEKNDLEIDYAYAEGAYEAYVLIMKKLIEGND